VQDQLVSEHFLLFCCVQEAIAAARRDRKVAV